MHYYMSVCNFQFIKSPMELNGLLLNFFIMSPGLMSDETRDLSNKAYFSNPVVSLKQKLSGLKN